MINGAYNANFLRQLWKSIKTKRPRKRMKCVLFDQESTPANKTIVSISTVCACGFELVDHTPHSDLAIIYSPAWKTFGNDYIGRWRLFDQHDKQSFLKNQMSIYMEINKAVINKIKKRGFQSSSITASSSLYVLLGHRRLNNRRLNITEMESIAINLQLI